MQIIRLKCIKSHKVWKFRVDFGKKKVNDRRFRAFSVAVNAYDTRYFKMHCVQIILKAMHDL